LVTQHKRVLDRLASTLSEIWSHRVRSVTEQSDSPSTPLGYWVAVCNVAANDRPRISRFQQTAYLRREI
jgi:hypothetical protein